MTPGMYVKAQTVAFEPMGLKKCVGSTDSGRTRASQKIACMWGMNAMRLTRFPIAFSVYVENADSTLVPHTLFCYTDDLIVIIAECHPLHCRRELPCVQAFAGRYQPQLQCVIGRSWYHVFWLCWDTMRWVKRPNISKWNTHSRHRSSRRYRYGHRKSLVVHHCGRTKHWWYCLLSRRRVDRPPSWIWFGSKTVRGLDEVNVAAVRKFARS